MFVALKQARTLFLKGEYSWETQFSISNVVIIGVQEYQDMQLALARDQSLLVVGDHFQLRHGVITKERVIAARGRTVHRANRETRRAVLRRALLRKISSQQMDP